MSSSVCTLTVYLPPLRGMSFRSSAPDGAILALPDGAESQDLQNIALFSSYMESNIDNWYRFANSVLGCDARNGDLRLVIGHDKSKSWGIGTFKNSGSTTQSELYFTPRPSSDTLSGSYSWACSGEAEARVGPSLRPEEAAALSAEDANPPLDNRYLNQSLFIRTLNARHSDGGWRKLCQELKTPHLDDTLQSSEKNTLSVWHPRSSHGQAHTEPTSPPGGKDSWRRSSQDTCNGLAGAQADGDLVISCPPTLFVSAVPLSRLCFHRAFLRTGKPSWRSSQSTTASEGEKKIGRFSQKSV